MYGRIIASSIATSSKKHGLKLAWRSINGCKSITRMMTAKISLEPCNNNNNNFERNIVTTKSSSLLLESNKRFMSLQAAAVEENDEERGLIPTRHSRHLDPQVCINVDQCLALTREILETAKGELFTYSLPSDQNEEEDDLWLAWKVADYTVQKVEWLIRGHAAQIQGTLMHQQILKQQEKQEEEEEEQDIQHQKQDFSNFSLSSNPLESLKLIKDLIVRMEQEGELYMKDRAKRSAQIALVKQQQQQDSSSDDDSDSDSSSSDEDEEQQQNPETTQNEQTNFTANDFASPGPSIVMWDTFIDAMATITTMQEEKENISNNDDESLKKLIHPQVASVIFDRIWTRYHIDGGPRSNVNPHTLPTIITSNGILRLLATTRFHHFDNMIMKDQQHNENEERMKFRDVSLRQALGVFEKFREAPVPRNAATYIYMTKCFATLIPPSFEQGNLAHSMYQMAITDRVVSPDLVDTMSQDIHVQQTCHNYQKLIRELEEKKNNNNKTYGLPLAWTKYNKSYRYRAQDNLY